MTVLSVARDAAGHDIRDATVDQIVGDTFGDRQVHHRRHVADDAAADVLHEAGLGYDLMVLGLNEEFSGTHELSAPLRRIISSSRIPVLLVRRSRMADFAVPAIQRVLVPVNGTRVGQAAEEIAYVLGARLGAVVDAVHVTATAGRRDEAGIGQLQRSRDLAERFGGGVNVAMRTGTVHEEVLQEAAERRCDLLVVGARTRGADLEQPFLGYGPEYLLEHAPMMVATIVFPSEQS